MTARRGRAWLGLLCYAVLTFALSWVPAALLHGLWQREAVPPALRLVVSAAIYALCMGWQPLVATWVVRNWVDRVNLDDILRTAKARYYGAATISPLALAAVAALIVLAAGRTGHNATADTSGTTSGVLLSTLLAVISLAAGLVLIWVQALAEEVGWRGYFLARFMKQVGPVTGLALHGAVWGLWYAPILLISDGGSTISGVSGATFVLTCILLGGLLGWLRLASKSVVPATLANSLLTVTAGLPFIVDGDDPGLRAAAYGPAGWLPMGIAFCLLLTTRLRHDIRTPRMEVVQDRTNVVLVVQPLDSPSRDRTLH